MHKSVAGWFHKDKLLSASSLFGHGNNSTFCEEETEEIALVTIYSIDS